MTAPYRVIVGDAPSGGRNTPVAAVGGPSLVKNREGGVSAGSHCRGEARHAARIRRRVRAKKKGATNRAPLESPRRAAPTTRPGLAPCVQNLTGSRAQ